MSLTGVVAILCGRSGWPPWMSGLGWDKTYRGLSCVDVELNDIQSLSEVTKIWNCAWLGRRIIPTSLPGMESSYNGDMKDGGVNDGEGLRGVVRQIPRNICHDLGYDLNETLSTKNHNLRVGDVRDWESLWSAAIEQHHAKPIPQVA